MSLPRLEIALWVPCYISRKVVVTWWYLEVVMVI